MFIVFLISDQVIKQATPCYNDELDGEYDRVDVKVLILRFAGIYRDSSHIKITRGICLIFTIEKYFNFIYKISLLTLVCVRPETPLDSALMEIFPLWTRHR